MPFDGTNWSGSGGGNEDYHLVVPALFVKALGDGFGITKKWISAAEDQLELIGRTVGDISHDAELKDKNLPPPGKVIVFGMTTLSNEWRALHKRQIDEATYVVSLNEDLAKQQIALHDSAFILPTYTKTLIQTGEPFHMVLGSAQGETECIIIGRARAKAHNSRHLVISHLT